MPGSIAQDIAHSSATMTIFLTQSDVENLTGRKRKSCQVDALRVMGIPFHINAAGRPVVTVAALEGKKVEKSDNKWKPAVLGQ